ncbi:MAG: hypothetical protein LUD71_08020 [Clostridiales bacterium]|nr:hypothetical protein [Clostridiales bacterium]
MAIANKKKVDLYPMWTVIVLFMMFIFGKVVPAWSSLTQMGVCMLGVFVGALIMTIFTNQTFWPAVIAIVAMVFHGYMTASDALTGWFGSSTVQQFIWIMAICGALKASGAPVVIAKKMLNMKICKGHPWAFIYMFFCATAVVGMLLSTATATILIMFPILDGIFEAAGFDSKNKNDQEFKKQMLLGTYLAAMGAYILPFKGVHLSSIAIISATLEGFGLSFDNGAYLISTLLCWIVFMILFLVLIRVFWKTDISKLTKFDISTMEGMTEDDLKLNKRQIILLCALLTGVLYIISLLLIPETWAGYATYNGMTATWIWIAIFAVLCLVKVDGEFFINGPAVLKDSTLWGVVALIGCFSFCGNAISSDTLGIKEWIMGLLSPLLGNVSWIVLVLLVVAIATITTNFMNGMPVSFTMNSIAVPFACAMVTTIGINPSVLGAAIVFSGQCAFMTYGAMVYAALLLSRDEVDNKFIFTKGWFVVATYIIAATVVFGICGYIL